MTLLARLIAKEEGFGIPGTKPTRLHNPGDLRHSPHSSHSPDAPNAIGAIDTVEHGWEDLERQLKLYAARGLTLRQMIVEKYAPEGENDSESYLAFVCEHLHVPDSTLVSVALQIPDPSPPGLRPGDVAAANLELPK
jgi:hypothetical protein